jgi:hypothetical protein
MSNDNRSYQAAVEATGEKDAIRDVAHHSAHYGLLKGVSELSKVHRIFGNNFGPLRLPVRLQTSFGGVVVARRECLYLDAVGNESLHLRSEPNRAILTGAHVKRTNTDGISSSKVCLTVADHKGKIPLYAVQEASTLLFVQIEENLTIGVGEKLMLFLELLLKVLVVVNLTVDDEDVGVLLIKKWLSTTLNVDNGKSLMGENVLALDVHSAPVWSSVTNAVLGKK